MMGVAIAVWALGYEAWLEQTAERLMSVDVLGPGREIVVYVSNRRHGGSAVFPVERRVLASIVAMGCPLALPPAVVLAALEATAERLSKEAPLDLGALLEEARRG